MAVNPMQRKARNSFIFGMLTMMIIAAIIIAILWMQLDKLNKKSKSDTQAKIKSPVLVQDVRSGQTLTPDMFQVKEVSKTSVPSEDIFSGDENYMAKIDLKANTIVTMSMVATEETKTTDDLREETYNMLSLPVDLNTGDYVDIRLMLPDGTDYIVLSKKKVTIPDDTGAPSPDTIKLDMSEKELLTMSSAIVEAYRIKGSKLYAIKYKEAGNQKAATATYRPREDIVTMIKANPNIVDRASAAIYNDLSTKYREGKINNYYNNGDSEDVVSGIQESTQKKQEDRKNYLSTLYGAQY